jgi:Tfp pilus assembly protein PilO
MDYKITSLLPKRSIVFVIICSAGILGFFLLDIYPNQRAAGALDAQIIKTRSQIEKQKTLSPVYEQLRKILKASKDIDGINLPFPAGKESSKREDVNHIRSLLYDIVKESRLETEKIEPDVATMLDDSGRIRIHISLAGDYSNFREFMILLIDRLPAIESVESLEIQRVTNSTDHRLLLAIRFAQE